MNILRSLIFSLTQTSGREEYIRLYQIMGELQPEGLERMPWPVVILKYFFKKRNEGQPFKKAVFATAHKLIRVIFAMFSNRTYFQENRWAIS